MDFCRLGGNAGEDLIKLGRVSYVEQNCLQSARGIARFGSARYTSMRTTVVVGLYAACEQCTADGTFGSPLKKSQ